MAKKANMSQPLETPGRPTDGDAYVDGLVKLSARKLDESYAAFHQLGAKRDAAKQKNLEIAVAGSKAAFTEGLRDIHNHINGMLLQANSKVDEDSQTMLDARADAHRQFQENLASAIKLRRKLSTPQTIATPQSAASGISTPLSSIDSMPVRPDPKPSGAKRSGLPYAEPAQALPIKPCNLPRGQGRRSGLCGERDRLG